MWQNGKQIEQSGKGFRIARATPAFIPRRHGCIPSGCTNITIGTDTPSASTLIVTLAVPTAHVSQLYHPYQTISPMLAITWVKVCPVISSV